MTTSASLLVVDGLTVQVSTGEGLRAILRNVSFELEAGQFLAIVGESGSGKSTLASALIGLLPPNIALTAGRIDFAGKVLNQLSDGALSAIRGKDIAYVPQDPGTSLNPVKTVGSQILEAFRVHETELPKAALKARAVALLDEVGIDRPELRLRQYPHQLSGGMKQRILLAIAFAHNPRVIIADEPTSALDVTVQKQVMAVFSRLVSSHGATVIFITHDIALAADHATHILVMDTGRVIEHGTSEQVLHAPRDPSTRRLIENAVHAPRDRQDQESLIVAPPIIDVEGLEKQFEQRRLFQRAAKGPRAVDGISFSVQEGTTFALVGESGSGKTTTARLIIGLEKPSGGTVRVHGADIAHVSPARRREVWRDIQLVHQNPFSSLNPRARIGDIIAAPLAAHGIGTAESRRLATSELLAQVGLPADCIDRRPNELSGGQRQRVAIARALALKARIIILDEPLSALDVVTQRQILALLRRLQRELGLTYIFISHDLGVVREFADDVGVMHRGRLVELGPVRDVFERPATDYTRLLLEALPGRALLHLATQAAAQ